MSIHRGNSTSPIIVRIKIFYLEKLIITQLELLKAM